MLVILAFGCRGGGTVGVVDGEPVDTVDTVDTGGGTTTVDSGTPSGACPFAGRFDLDYASCGGEWPIAGTADITGYADQCNIVLTTYDFDEECEVAEVIELTWVVEEWEEYWTGWTNGGHSTDPSGCRDLLGAVDLGRVEVGAFEPYPDSLQVTFDPVLPVALAGCDEPPVYVNFVRAP